MTGYRVQAQNPKGLNYDVQANTVEDVKGWIRLILARGGSDVTVNGKPVPEELLASL